MTPERREPSGKRKRESEPAPARRPEADGARLLQLAGVAAAVVLAVGVNVLAARHFTRWDWTQARRWSVSSGTLQTLQGLDRPVELWIVAGRGDPLEPSLRQLVGAYTAAAPGSGGDSRLQVHWIDPDRDAAQLVDLQRRFGLEAGRTEDGRVATDAVVIVASGEKHWFLTHEDLVEPSDDAHVKPREERALTQAIRSVLGGERAKLCFTVGHGELLLDAPKDERDSLGGVRDLLEKDNYELASVDTSAPDAHEPFTGCAVVVLAGPREPFSSEETNRLRTWLLEGGSLLAAVGPPDAAEGAADGGRLASAGLDAALAPFGIALDDDVVHDVDPAVAIPDTHGEAFFVAAQPHPVTAGLVTGGSDAHPPRVAAFFARSLGHVSPPGATVAADLLVTGDSAYAKTSLAGAAQWTGAPPRDPGDRAGPFVVAMAAERPRAGPDAPHGPRVVVVGSRFALAEDNWRQPRALHGAAFFVDSALSWLAARPQVVDVPERAEVAVAVRISEAGRDEVRRYVLVLMPLAALLLSLGVWAWRKSSENAPYAPLAGRAEDEGRRS
jgi:hypothetical protein